MTALLLSLSLFGSALLAHLLLWRIWLPRPATGVLLGLFSVIGVAGLLVAVWPLAIVSSPWQLGQPGLFHAAWSLTYIIIYTGIEETSPSLAVVRAVHRAGAGGCSLEDLKRVVEEANFLGRRLELLRAEGLAVQEAGNWRLTDKGARVARLVARASSALLNLPKGG